MKSKSNPFFHSPAYLLAVLILCSQTGVSFGQVLIEDSEGSNVFMQLGKKDYNGGLNFSTNIKNKNLTIRNFIRSGSSASPIFHAFEIKGKINNSISTLFSNKKVNPGVGIGYNFIKTDFLTSPRDRGYAIDWLILTANYDASALSFFAEDTIFTKQVTNKNIASLSFSGNYTRFIKGKFFIGLTLGYKRDNNYGQLTNVDIEEVRTFSDSSSSTVRVVKRSRTAREGEFVEFDSYPLRFHVTFEPTEDISKENKILLGSSFYFLRNINKLQTTSDFGINIHITKANKKAGSQKGVRNAVVSFFIEAKDVFDERDKNNSLEDRLVFGIVTSFSLFK